DALSRPLAVCGQQLVADNSGALYWPAQGALLVADLPLVDLHREGSAATRLGYGSAGAARRALVKLAEVMDRYEPAKVLVIGASAHEAATGGMTAEDVQILRILQEDHDWIWITGKDTGRDTGKDTGQDAGTASPHLGGRACAELEIGGIRL